MGKKMAGLGTIIEGKNAVLSVLESGRAIKISYLHQETKSENFETILNLAKRNKVEISAIKSKEAWPYHPRHSIVALCNPKKTFKEKDMINLQIKILLSATTFKIQIILELLHAVRQHLTLKS
jgi:tRNA G18 (ribose-2'-O)-methylase SpoU